MIVLDTSLLVEILEDGPKASWIRDQLSLLPETESLACSVITTFEMLNARKPEAFEKSPLMKIVRVLPVDQAVARRASWIFAQSFARSRRKIPDALIAATALIYRARLWTLDSDFKKIPGLPLI